MSDPTRPPARPFLDWPVVTDPAHWDAQVALIGLPLSEPYQCDPRPNDQSTAPGAIRAASSQFCDGRDHWDFSLGGELAAILPPGCIDCGDVPWLGGDYDAHAARVTGLLGGLWRRGAQVIVLGGDHGVTIPVVDALEALGEPVHLIQIDAHLDWREEVGGVRRGYSSPMRWASRRPWIAGMTQIGLRGTGSARRDEYRAAIAYGSTLFPAHEIHRDGGMRRVLDSIPRGRPLYVTIDADGLDPGIMPGVMGPVPGGLRFDQVECLLRQLGRHWRVAGMDVVEVAPGFDFANRLICITAGRLVLTLLGAAWGESAPVS
jgi:agmatinase